MGLANLTNEELLQAVYLKHAENEVVQELAKRLDDALDSLAEVASVLKVANVRSTGELMEFINRFIDDNK